MIAVREAARAAANPVAHIMRYWQKRRIALRGNWPVMIANCKPISLGIAAALVFSVSAVLAQDKPAASCKADAAASPSVIAECDAALAVNTAARVELLLGRAVLYRRSQQRELALADYAEAMKLQPGAKVLFARGETWREAGDRRRALADFDAALKLDPASEPLRAARKALAQEIERAGAMMPVQPGK